MRKILSVLLFLIFCSLFLVRPASADNKFSITYDLSYKVAETGITSVTQNFQLTNKTSEFFPQEYVSKIGKKEIGNVQAFDKTGPLTVNVDGEDVNRSIHIKFNNQSAGIGHVLNWTLSYDTNEIAKKNNQIWEIFIPRPNDLEDIDDYTIGLYVPKSFGKPFIYKPKPNSSDHIWTKSELTSSGIFANYFLGSGDNPNQIYDFKLRYHLHNSKLYPVETEVAIPSDSNYQKVYLQTLLPQPVNVVIDNDGNWLAKYLLGPAANLDVTASGSAVVFYQPQFPVEPTKLENDLRSQRYWEANNSLVISLAKKYATPEAIYDYVVKTLKYDFNRAKNNLSRLGATGILYTPDKAICLEFTDLYIAMARAAGIPTREVDGYAVAFDRLHQPTAIQRDSLHSWPEYFDKESKTWRMIDPTWGNTTSGIDYFHSLDTNHLAFVIKGDNSTTPTPAGTYKLNSSQINDVEVNYHQGDFNINQQPNISLRTNMTMSLIAGFPFSGKIYLDNNGPTTYAKNHVLLSAQSLDIVNQDQPTSTIPPFGHLELPFSILPINWDRTQNDIITLKFAGFQKDYPVAVLPLYNNLFIVVIGGLTTLGILSIIAQITWRIYLQKSKRRDNLHRKS